MRLPLLLAALCLSLLSGCSTVRPSVPAKVDPPPVLLTMPCLAPDDLAAKATAQDLAVWAMGWMGAYWCERDRRAALIEAWPH